MRTRRSSGRAPRACIIAVLALAASLVIVAGAPAVQSDPAPAPCTPGAGGEHNCTFYPAGDGISAGAPVVDSSGAKVGYLNHGTNFVLCEAYGEQVGTPATYNHWWAWTEANDGRYGWVSAYYAQGGDNDGAFQGVADCAGAHGSPPGGSSAPPSTEVPCSAITGGRYNCDFYPAGDGRTGGAPVRSSTGALVGYLNQGENYVLCQATGEEVGSSTVYNNRWAYTLADDNRYGWVNAYYASGGANNGPFQNVPQCGTAHGYPPGGAPAPSPPPAPKPTGPKPATCGHTATSQYTCDFYPAGDGVSGGAPVEAANQQGVGYLNEGRNWITCEQTGGEVTVGADHNDWWGRTEADNGAWGWVNAVYTRDGDNDGPFSGVPNCHGADGATPQGAVVAPPGSGGGGGGGGGTNPPGSGGAPNEIPPVYVPMYRASGAQYGVNWLLIASIHAQETNFSRSGLPGVRSGLNNAGCCAGPTQFSVVSGADTWASYENAFVPISADRPAHYPLQSGVTVCASKGGHPCVYDDFDAISATGSYLHADGAGQSLAASSTYQAVKNYGDSSDYANQVINRAEHWQAGSGGSSHFANVLYQTAAIKVSAQAPRPIAAGTATQTATRRPRRLQPKLSVLVSYHGTSKRARAAFRAFIAAYHYARPGVTYTVHYTHVKAARPRERQ
jgi:hypothetical protein